MMLLIATDVPLGWYISQPMMQLCCAKMAAQIEVLFGAEAVGDVWHIVLRGRDFISLL